MVITEEEWKLLKEKESYGIYVELSNRIYRLEQHQTIIEAKIKKFDERIEYIAINTKNF